jgi:Transposase DDE domain
MTNLDDSFTAQDLAEIYRLRWGIETAYNYFKNTFMLGTFSGYSPTAVMQDIWCVLIMYNLQTIIQYDCHPELEEINKRRKADYKFNRNVGAGTLRNHLKSLFLGTKSKVQQAIKHIEKLFLASLEKVKPNKQERDRKRLRSNELNYKRGF